MPMCSSRGFDVESVRPPLQPHSLTGGQALSLQQMVSRLVLFPIRVWYTILVDQPYRSHAPLHWTDGLAASPVMAGTIIGRQAKSNHIYEGRHTAHNYLRLSTSIVRLS